LLLQGNFNLLLIDAIITFKKEIKRSNESNKSCFMGDILHLMKHDEKNDPMFLQSSDVYHLVKS